QVPFLGEVPLDPEVRIGGDNGEPIVAKDPDCLVSQAFINIAKQVAAQISISSLNRTTEATPAAV
ncbi:MAG: P-loop NTPase, partial [Cyanobacteria bacterium SZAS LIN-2]|nr:P-loop NTPase [Cyanobacteria bacterium SZAS LIN-2]